MEVDPFEARLEFLGLLGKLNASQHSIQKVGNFAMRNRNLYEDLYSCIVEQLEQTPSINAKMNIFYVLDSICHQSQKAGFSGYIDLIQKNLTRIIECVTPSGPTGNVNVAGTKKILESWRAKKLFHEVAIDKVEKPLLARELGASAPATTDAGFTKEDILKRMDEDRERHKRIREEIWIRPSDEDPAAEVLQTWDEASDLDDNDYENMDNENEKYKPSYPWILEFDRFLPSPAMFKSKAVSGASTEFSMDSSAAGMKRLASPEGTVSVSSMNASSLLPPTAPMTEYHHNGYHQASRGHPQPFSYSQSHPQPRQHYHHQQQSNHANTSSSSSVADAASSSHRPSAPSYHSHSRPQHRERTISSSNGYNDHVP
ncbi:CTD kinase subunit gamma CTK3-domain-containing protein [Dissophora ornata]|nr:CTD kinase subunit gamma CTK3-domain-containing protein [Dissophora ornata]